MKVVVDRDRCEAHGVCARLAPDVFRVDDEDVLHVLVQPPSRHLAVERAVLACPKGALSLTDDVDFGSHPPASR